MMTRKKYPNPSLWQADVSPAPLALNYLINRGSIAREGDWYRIYDIQVLGEDLFGLVKRLLVNDREIMVQLYR